MTAPRLGQLGTWLAGSILALCASGTAAQQAPLTLRDAWLSLDTPPPSPAYTFYQRRGDNAELPQRLTRLVAELKVIGQEMSLAPDDTMPGLISWHDQALTLAATPHQSRSLGRADLATLVARPRLNPPLASLDKAGFCRTPDWVELWHPAGVTRVAYRPGLALDDALAEVGLASGAARATIGDHVTWVSPMGDLHRVVVQAFNHQSLSLPPGSRIVVPITHASPSARWVNTHLPALLTTRLPGDDCQYLITDSPTTADPS